jgi:predicted metalloprotease with PDZ domain
VGISRQARRWFDGGIATLIPVPVGLAEAGTPVDQVRASYADFIWGVLPERSSTYPTLGLSTRAGEGGRRVVIQVEKDSAAAAAGFELNDVLLSLDDHPLTDRETLNVLMARKMWGDAARFVVKRGDADKTLTAYFRRPAPVATPAPATPTSSGKDKKAPPPKKPSPKE